MDKVKKIILLFLLITVTVGCSKVDDIRDPISVRKVDFEYVKNGQPIDSLIVYTEDSIIGEKVSLELDDDHDWFFEMLRENKKMLTDKKKPNSYQVLLRFSEGTWSIDYDPGKYNGKITSFYMSEELRNEFIRRYKHKHPVTTILKNDDLSFNGDLEGSVNISSGNRTLVLDEITLELYSSVDRSSLKTWTITKNLVISPNTEETIPFKFKLPKNTSVSENKKTVFLNTVVQPIELELSNQLQLTIK